MRSSVKLEREALLVGCLSTLDDFDAWFESLDSALRAPNLKRLSKIRHSLECVIEEIEELGLIFAPKKHHIPAFCKARPQYIEY